VTRFLSLAGSEHLLATLDLKDKKGAVIAMKRIYVVGLALCLLLILTLALGTACEGTYGTDVATSSDSLAENVDITATEADGVIPPTESESPALPSIANVVAVVTPSVVTIDTEVTVNFFRQSYTQEGAGSGWIIDESGIIVTNAHVVEGAETIIVTLHDGRAFTADSNMIAIDQLNDLAVIKIDAENLPTLDIGDSSELRVGDWVVAIGNPLGLGTSAKEGIVSRLDVSLTVDSQMMYDLIETSAAINPGNSGGPLVSMKGEVIGITSAKVSSVGVEGLGYAISTDYAMPIIEELIETYHIQ